MSALAVLALCVVGAWAQQSGSQITSLPGISNSDWTFNQYSGYANVNPETGRHLFYWFTEAQTNPETAPVALWLNGGPGCSSLGGFFEELGPFTPVPDANGNVTLQVNPYSWNTVANIIFLESPSGVGFSYSDNISDYTVGDARTANDSYNFLLQFFQWFPQFAKNPFWVTGESYGGHYVPTLSARILLGNSQNPQQTINFQGFMVGNAWTYAPYDNYGAVYDWYTHALIAQETYEGLVNTCDFFGIGPLTEVAATSCDGWQTIASNQMGNIDIYDVYADVCLAGQSGQGKQLLRYLAMSDESKLATFAKHRLTKIHAEEYLPCVDNYLSTYLNQPEVKAAIHANTDITWLGCSSVVNYNYQDLLSSVLPVYQELLQEDITIVVYSGDVDAIVPTPGTRIWLNQLNLTILEQWRPWIASNQQVGGYTVGYDGLTFLTIRGAGHLVPGTQPLRALNFFERVLNGQPL